MSERLRSLAVLAGLVVVTLALGRLGSLASGPALESWYPGLTRPALTPPPWVFALVWTLLYLSMAVAAWLVWRAAGGLRAAGGALGLWAAQLLVNAAWPLVYFGLRSPLLGLIDIALLLPLLLATLLAFRRHAPAAARLLLPYLAWSLFGAWLNVEIWRLN